jgi:hypothetical protein
LAKMVELSDYERERLQRLEKNKEMLERLGLTGKTAQDLKEQISGECSFRIRKQARMPMSVFCRCNSGLRALAGAPVIVAQKKTDTVKKRKERAQRLAAEPTRRSGRNAGKEPVIVCGRQSDVRNLELVFLLSSTTLTTSC